MSFSTQDTSGGSATGIKYAGDPGTTVGPTESLLKYMSDLSAQSMGSRNALRYGKKGTPAAAAGTGGTGSGPLGGFTTTPVPGGSGPQGGFGSSPGGVGGTGSGPAAGGASPTVGGQFGGGQPGDGGSQPIDIPTPAVPAPPPPDPLGGANSIASTPVGTTSSLRAVPTSDGSGAPAPAPAPAPGPGTAFGPPAPVPGDARGKEVVPIGAGSGNPGGTVPGFTPVVGSGNTNNGNPGTPAGNPTPDYSAGAGTAGGIGGMYDSWMNSTGFDPKTLEAIRNQSAQAARGASDSANADINQRFAGTGNEAGFYAGRGNVARGEQQAMADTAQKTDIANYSEGQRQRELGTAGNQGLYNADTSDLNNYLSQLNTLTGRKRGVATQSVGSGSSSGIDFGALLALL